MIPTISYYLSLITDQTEMIKTEMIPKLLFSNE